MMTRQQRAKQFMPFDAMKGLQEALRDREERHTRVERHEISDEMKEQISAVILRLEKGTRVVIDYYCDFHDVTKKAVVTEMSISLRYLKLHEETIRFEDIYRIVITDNPSIRSF